MWNPEDHVGRDLLIFVTKIAMSSSQQNFTLGVFGENHFRMVSFEQIAVNKQIRFKWALYLSSTKVLQRILQLQSVFTVM